MNYPLWRGALSDHAVNMMNLAGGDRNIDIDDLVAGVLPDRIRAGVAEADGSPGGRRRAVLSRALVYLCRDSRTAG